MRFVLLLLFLFRRATAENTVNQQCRLYLAPSTTSTHEHPVFGIFAGVDYEPNETVGAHEVAIQLIEIEDQNEEESDTLDFLVSQLWSYDSTGGQYEASGTVTTSIPGVGSLASSHPGIINADWNRKSVFFRRPMGEQPGKSHPGRGAFSPYYNVSLMSTQYIPAGAEIFVDVGNDDGGSPQDNQDADKIIDELLEFMNKYDDQMDTERKEQVLEFLINTVLGDAGGGSAEHLRSLLPTNPDELQTIKEAGGTLLHNRPKLRRDLDWLEKNGQCLDNLRAGASTIPEAGRGAFATRPIRKGAVVSPVPLIQIPYESVLDMYMLSDTTDEDGDSVTLRKSDEVVGTQLLYNYCFGHPESTLLLHPIGPVSNLINHKPGSQANARIVWSSNKSNNKRWFDLHPAKLVQEKNQHIGLMFDVIATRDIEAGEEVFIDYGPEWAAAWKSHAEDWSERVAIGEISSSWPLGALDLNEKYREEPFKTPKELEQEPYPGGVMTVCFIMAEDDDAGEEKQPFVRWTEGDDVYSGESLRVCNIISRRKISEDEGGEYKYIVSVRDESEEGLVVVDIPHQAILFVDKPYHGDIHMEHAFRHYIGIPNDIFPETWRNIKG